VNPRPLWRWWLYCAALWLWFRLSWRPALDLSGWCVLPDWLGYYEDPCQGLCLVSYDEKFDRVCHRRAGHAGECEGPTAAEHRALMEVPF
jgi:hypothetical protein